ncbi:MAG TPA: hypothetical protein DEW39_03735 [Brevibacterium sp.]|uniref:hypothetical protein n=1 Tax=Brevibacterium antiquum TaxID=234835 RepID=UPI000C77A91D|nr:hypothetical protein [Brevibacterium antiquum]HCG55267.1 hypothetical protein [Brevibacterium sp.]
MTVIMGNAFGLSVTSGIESVNEGGATWILELIVFPLAVLVGIVSLLLKHRKRAPAQNRRPNPCESGQDPEQPR